MALSVILCQWSWFSFPWSSQKKKQTQNKRAFRRKVSTCAPSFGLAISFAFAFVKVDNRCIVIVGRSHFKCLLQSTAHVRYGEDVKWKVNLGKEFNFYANAVYGNVKSNWRTSHSSWRQTSTVHSLTMLTVLCWLCSRPSEAGVHLDGECDCFVQPLW